jgi:hypothetical protein
MVDNEQLRKTKNAAIHLGHYVRCCMFATRVVATTLWKTRTHATYVLYPRYDRGDSEGLLGHAFSSLVLANCDIPISSEQSPRRTASVAFWLDTCPSDSSRLYNRSHFDAGRTKSNGKMGCFHTREEGQIIVVLLPPGPARRASDDRCER